MCRGPRHRQQSHVNQNLNGSRDPTTPLSGIFCHRRLGLATINVPTKFEVSIFTRYEDMKGDTKCRKWGGLLLFFNSNYATILHHFLDIARYCYILAPRKSFDILALYKSDYYYIIIIIIGQRAPIFDLPHFHLAPSFGICPLAFCRDL